MNIIQFKTLVIAYKLLQTHLTELENGKLFRHHLTEFV